MKKYFGITENNGIVASTANIVSNLALYTTGVIAMIVGFKGTYSCFVKREGDFVSALTIFYANNKPLFNVLGTIGFLVVSLAVIAASFKFISAGLEQINGNEVFEDIK